MKSAYDYAGAKQLMDAWYVLDENGDEYDVRGVDVYSIIRYITDRIMSPQELIDLVLEAAVDNKAEDDAHMEALTMNEMIAKDPTIVDDWDAFDAMLDQQDLGDVDPSTYQIQEDDGCEGGACRI